MKHNIFDLTSSDVTKGDIEVYSTKKRITLKTMENLVTYDGTIYTIHKMLRIRFS